MKLWSLRDWSQLAARGGLPFTEAIVILAVAIPTAGLLFFMNRAMEGERERMLRELQSNREQALEAARAAVKIRLEKKLEAAAPNQMKAGPPGENFVTIMARGEVEGCVLLNEMGKVVFPTLTQAPLPEPTSRMDMLVADAALKSLEEGSLPTAADLQALEQTFRKERNRHSMMPTGRKYWPMAQLAHWLKLSPEAPEFAALSEQLRKVAENYGDALMPSAQRLHLFHALQARGVKVDLPHAEAEAFSVRMAGDFSSPAEPGILRPTADAEVLQVLVEGSRWVLFFGTEELRHDLEREAKLVLEPMNLEVALGPHLRGGRAPLSAISAGRELPGWELSMFGQDASLAIAERIGQLKRLYFWSAVGGSILIGFLAAWAIRRFARSARDTKLKQDFLSTVSHELKTPLTSIRMFVDTLVADGVGDAERTAMYLEHISRENQRLSRLVDNFLTFSRLESNRLAFDFQPTHPDEAAEAARDAVASRMDLPGCEFLYSSDPHLPLIRADVTSLTTALVNLLDNAVKYSREDKKILFSVTLDAQSVVFAVTDNGIGMDAETIRRLGEKYFRGRGWQRSGREGFGLGLSIVRSIVEAHGGTLEIRSEPAAGSRFSIRLPALEKAS